MNISFIKIFFIGAATWLAGMLILMALLWSVSDGLPPLERLEQYDPQLITRVISSDGVVIKEFYTQRRVLAPLDAMPDYLVKAVIATEDRRFYSHWGLDLIRLSKALMVNISAMGIRQGASTITQQLARNLYFSHRRTLSRKLKELITAIQIERRYSKREILEMYLTQTYFGSGAYGAQAATQRYFSKAVEELTLDESALLVALLKAPTTYSPIHRPEAALKRRNLVLRNMLKWGYIEEAEYSEARGKPLALNVSEEESPLGTAPYFTEYVRQELESMEEKYGFDYYHDGLNIYTTLDSRIQAFAEAALDSNLPALEERFQSRFREEQLMAFMAAQFPDLELDSVETLAQDSVLVDSLFRDKKVVQAAFIALEPGTGRILAMIGGRDFAQYKFNRAVQAVRQPGSAFKPIVYLAAIDNGYPPTFRLMNQDVVVVNEDGRRWAPQNYDHSRGGLTTLRDGLRWSLNLVSVRLVQDVVPPRMVIQYARKLGITTRLANVDAIALGASAVKPIELVNAFSVFPSGGVLAEPYAIERIVDRYENIIEENRPKRKVVISEETAYVMTSMLRTVLDRGTGGSVRWRFKFYRPAGGKTGTTNEYNNAWFIGFTPQICAGVWVGLDDPFLTLGRGQTGSKAALPIWAQFMKTLYDSLKLPVEDFEKPEGVVEMEVCAETYKIAGKHCPNKEKEVFITKYAPTDSCDVHRGRRKW